jgi:hypothetical protein
MAWTSKCVFPSPWFSVLLEWRGRACGYGMDGFWEGEVGGVDGMGSAGIGTGLDTFDID